MNVVLVVLTLIVLPYSVMSFARHWGIRPCTAFSFLCAVYCAVYIAVLTWIGSETLALIDPLNVVIAAALVVGSSLMADRMC